MPAHWLRRGMTDRRRLRNPYDLAMLPRGIHRVAAWDYTADSLAALSEVFSGGECGGVMPSDCEERERYVHCWNRRRRHIDAP